jgi:ankyrin repeat protein
MRWLRRLFPPRRLPGLRRRDECALHQAVLDDDLRRLRWALAAGCDVNEAVQVHGTPLARAASAAMVTLLLDAGADPLAGEPTAMEALAYEGEPDAVAMLLRRRPELVHWRLRHDKTPLHIAAAGGNHRVARLLLDAGADIHAASDDGSMSGMTPLHEAGLSERPACVHLLLQRGADPSRRMSDGRLPIDMSETIVSDMTVRPLMREALKRSPPKLDLTAAVHRLIVLDDGQLVAVHIGGAITRWGRSTLTMIDAFDSGHSLSNGLALVMRPNPDAGEPRRDVVMLGGRAGDIRFVDFENKRTPFSFGALSPFGQALAASRTHVTAADRQDVVYLGPATGGGRMKFRGGECSTDALCLTADRLYIGRSLSSGVEVGVVRLNEPVVELPSLPIPGRRLERDEPYYETISDLCMTPSGLAVFCTTGYADERVGFVEMDEPTALATDGTAIWAGTAGGMVVRV